MRVLKSPQDAASGVIPRNQRSESPLSQTAGV
jgi:hypothetical protein